LNRQKEINFEDSFWKRERERVSKVEIERRVFCFPQKIIGDKKFQLIEIRQKEERREVNNITGRAVSFLNDVIIAN